MDVEGAELRADKGGGMAVAQVSFQLEGGWDWGCRRFDKGIFGPQRVYRDEAPLHVTH